MNKILREKIFVVADRVEEYSLYAVLFFIPISVALVELFIGFALLAFIIKKITFPDFTFIKSRIHFLLLVFFIFCGLSLLNSALYLNKSLITLFFKWGKYIFVFFLAQDTLVSHQRIKNAVRVLLITGCLVVIDCFFQYFFGWEFLRGGKLIVLAGGIKAITGPFKHYNALAAYLVCISVLFIAAISIKSNSQFYVSLRNRVMFYGMFLGLFLLAVCLLLTFSRGGWVGFLSAGLLMLFLFGKRKFILLFFCFFMLAMVLFPMIRERAIFIFQSGGDANRFALWRGAWAMIKERPFLGKGIGTFMPYFSSYIKGLGVQYAHNSFLQIWAETGIFALGSFLSFIALILWQGIEAFRRSQDYITLGLLCAIFGFLVLSFFDNHLYKVQLAVLFWFMIGMLVAVSNIKNKEIIYGGISHD